MGIRINVLRHLDCVEFRGSRKICSLCVVNETYDDTIQLYFNPWMQDHRVYVAKSKNICISDINNLLLMKTLGY